MRLRSSGSIGRRDISIEAAANVANKLLARDVACGGSLSLLADQPGIEEAP